MIRNLAKVIGAVIIAITFTLPSAVLDDSLTSSDGFRASAAERQHWITSADPGSPELHDRYISSPETETSNQPPSRDLFTCARASRLCEWYANRSDKGQNSNEDSDSGPVASDRDRNESSGSQENRSVVGWQSASISSLQSEQYPDPKSLDIPSLSISADISGVGIDLNREMQVPDEFNTVGWYRHGPSPGQDGSSVIAGHLDDYSGRSVFYDLQYIELDAIITVGFEDGSSKEFRVTNKDSYDAGNLPSDSLFRRDGVPVLSLLTCGGSWDSSLGRYSETVVVYAVPV